MAFDLGCRKSGNIGYHLARTRRVLEEMLRRAVVISVGTWDVTQVAAEEFYEALEACVRLVRRLHVRLFTSGTQAIWRFQAAGVYGSV